MRLYSRYKKIKFVVSYKSDTCTFNKSITNDNIPIINAKTSLIRKVGKRGVLGISVANKHKIRHRYQLEDR